MSEARPVINCHDHEITYSPCFFFNTSMVKTSYYAEEAHVPKCLGAESENDSTSGRQCSETQRAQGDDTTLTQPAFSRHLCYRSDKPMVSLTADRTADPLHILWPHRW